MEEKEIINQLEEKKKLPKKIKALTEEEYEKWYKSNCGVGSCSNCPFITTCM